jgi:hypothetical protein
MASRDHCYTIQINTNNGQTIRQQLSQAFSICFQFVDVSSEDVQPFLQVVVG